MPGRSAFPTVWIVAAAEILPDRRKVVIEVVSVWQSKAKAEAAAYRCHKANPNRSVDVTERPIMEA